MRKSALLLIAAFALAGCSSPAEGESASATSTAEVTAQPATPSPSSAPTPSAEPPTTPAALTVEEAAQTYLDGVCPSNAAVRALSDEANTAFTAGVPLNVAAANEKAAATRDSYRTLVEKFTADTTVWPELVDADIDALVETIYTDVALTGQMADAPDEATFIGSWNVWTDPVRQAETSGVPQKIRAKLELPADSKASCEGR
jgi:hypothetical protein